MERAEGVPAGLNHNFFSGHRLWLIAGILGILSVIIIVMMVWKPGSGCGPLYRC